MSRAAASIFFSRNMERNSTPFILCFLGWSTNLWWNRSRGCSGRGLSEAWNRLSTLYNQHTDVYATKKTQKSSKRLLELVKLYIYKTWEFRQTHGHWSAILVREDEEQIAVTLLRWLTRLSWTAWAWLCICNTPLLVLISGKKFIWVVGLLDGTISIIGHEIKQEAIGAREIVYL